MFQTILEKRFIFFIISGVFILFSVFMLFFGKLNLGIDMTWGTQQEFRFTEMQWELEDIWEIAHMVQDHINTQEQNVITTVEVYRVAWEDIFVVQAWFSRQFSDEELEPWKIAFRDQLSDQYAAVGDIELARYVNIWASFGTYIRKTALITPVSYTHLTLPTKRIV